jgi:hypothetical protein
MARSSLFELSSRLWGAGLFVAVLATSAFSAHEIGSPEDQETFYVRPNGYSDTFSPYGYTHWSAQSSTQQILVVVRLDYDSPNVPELAQYYANIECGSWWEGDYNFSPNFEGTWTVKIRPYPYTEEADVHSGNLTLDGGA